MMDRVSRLVSCSLGFLGLISILWLVCKGYREGRGFGYLILYNIVLIAGVDVIQSQSQSVQMMVIKLL